MVNEEPKQTLLTQKQVEERIGAGTTGIYKWIKAGKFPAPIKPGGPMGKKYYRIEDIEAFEQGKWQHEQN